MKKVKIDINPHIDFGRAQWVISTSNHVVLSTGEHYGKSFTGTCLPCDLYPVGNYSKSWDKEQFKLLTFDIPFIISND